MPIYILKEAVNGHLCRREEIKAVFEGRNVMPVAVVGATYMNPRQKKEDDERRRRKTKGNYDRHFNDGVKREMPEDSTICYYA